MVQLSYLEILANILQQEVAAACLNSKEILDSELGGV